jgi:hypothetical protein
MPVFIGLSGTPETEVVLNGNDLKNVKRAIGAGSTYEHLRP